MGTLSRTDYQMPSVNNEDALSDLWVSKCENGTLVWVQAEQSYYALNKASGATPIAGSIVAPRNGAPIAGAPSARWTRQALGGSSGFAQQPSWYIDPVVGSDSASGLTAPTALKTLAQLATRLRGQIIDQQVDIYVTSSTPTSDNFYLTCAITPNGVIIIHGTPTTLHTGSLTGVVDLDPSTSQPSQIVDTAIPASWTASGLLNKRIRLTNGAQVGAKAWIAKDLGAKTARTSAWEQFDGSTPPFSPAPLTPVNAPNGSAYVVEELTVINGNVILDITAPLTFAGPGGIRFMMVDLAPITDAMAIISRGGGNSQLLGVAHCDVAAAVVLSGAVRFFNCSFVATEIQTGTVVDYQGGLCGEWVFSVNYGAQCGMRDVFSQGGGLRVLGELFLAGNGGVGIFDVAGAGGAVDGLLVEPGGLARDNLIWGLNNAAYGIHVRSGGAVVYQAKPTVTGATNDTIVGGAALAYASIPAVTAANNAMIVADA